MSVAQQERWWSSWEEKDGTRDWRGPERKLCEPQPPVWHGRWQGLSWVPVLPEAQQSGCALIHGALFQ